MWIICLLMSYLWIHIPVGRPSVWLMVTPLTALFMKKHHVFMTLLFFATTSSHQLLDRDRDPAALPWHQPRPVYPLLPVSCVAVRMPGEDHAPQVLSLCGQEWSDPSWGPQGELRLQKNILFGFLSRLVWWWWCWLPVVMSVVQMLLVGTGFTQQTEEQYFQFLAKFEIALPVANNR